MSSTTQRTDPAPRYFCYACNCEVPIYMAPDPTCQRCNEQFVQEIDPESDPQSFLSGGGDAAADAGQDRSNAYFRYDNQNGNDLFQFLDVLGPRDGSEEPSGGNNENRPPPAALSNMLQSVMTMLLSQPPDSPPNDQASDEEGEGSRQPGSQQSHSMLFYGGMVDGHLQFRPMNLSPQQQQQQGEAGQNTPGNVEDTANTAQPPTEEGAATGDDARGGGDNRVNNFASSLMRLLYGLSEGVVGNPNDYVFSQDGFDSIITQLMEQANGRNAPPPAPETIIDTLPKRTLTDKEIADRTDCPVCKDEFGTTEVVNELPCQHVFHEDCIKPWLKVNGTCPVCRHSVLPEKKGEDTGLSDSDNANTRADDGSSSSSSNININQATNSTNEAPTSPPSASAAERLSPAFSSLLGDPRGQLPSLVGWFNNYRNSNNQQQQPSTSSPSSNTGNTNNNNTPQQPSSDSNNHSEMDLDLD